MTERNMNPNEELGILVAESLASEELIVTDDMENIVSKICNGRMTIGEWKSCIEMKILKDEGKLEDGGSNQEN